MITLTKIKIGLLLFLFIFLFLYFTPKNASATFCVHGPYKYIAICENNVCREGFEIIEHYACTSKTRIEENIAYTDLEKIYNAAFAEKNIQEANGIYQVDVKSLCAISDNSGCYSVIKLSQSVSGTDLESYKLEWKSKGAQTEAKALESAIKSQIISAIIAIIFALIIISLPLVFFWFAFKKGFSFLHIIIIVANFLLFFLFTFFFALFFDLPNLFVFISKILIIIILLSLISELLCVFFVVIKKLLRRFFIK